MVLRIPALKSNNAVRLIVRVFAIGVALTLLTAIFVDLRVTVAISICLYLLFVVAVSFWGSLAVSVIASVASVFCIDYFFVPPTLSFQITDPFDAIAIVLFITTSWSITTLLTRLRIRTHQLEVTNANLKEQIEARARTQEALAQAQDIARVNRVMLMGEMSASLAHEINQPLTGIIANAGTSLRYLSAATPDLDEARTHIEFIARDGRRAAEIVGRVRAMVRRAPPSRSPLDINETIREVITLAEGQIHKTPLDLQIDLTNGLPAIPADRVQLQQVILNLTINAIDAMQSMPVRERALVIASGEDDAEHIFVEVRDSGPGFDGTNMDQLFTPFFTTKPDGMGMGLSISRLIVEGHGGRLWARPNTPHGAVFRLTLPRSVIAYADA